MSESEWVNGLLASCREWDGKAMNAIEGLSPEQLNWRPDKDTWSVLQQFHHLVLANGPYMGIIERLALEAPGHFKDYRPGLWGKFLLLAVGPEEKLPGPVPKQLVPAESELTKSVVDEFQALQSRFYQVLSSLGGKDLNGRFTSPFAKFVRLKQGDAIHITERHNVRHLGKAIRLIERPDFPR